MLPIAILPVAALLLRFGSADLLDIAFIRASGDAVFANLPLIFAIGIAIGIANDNHGAAGLAAAISHMILVNGVTTINPEIRMGVLSGIVSGLLAGYLYNRFKSTKLPDWLGFFGGKRFVPIITALCSIFIAFILGQVFPIIGAGIDRAGLWMIESGETGLFTYGALQRLLIPFGLHHILNSIVRFMFGSFIDMNGVEIIGDQLRFFAGDPTAGDFMTGAYLVMMFGLPAAALSFYVTAKKEKRKLIAGMLISVAATSFLTGITEPIEFLFMFTAPVLFLLHAAFMGLAYVVTAMVGIKHGFGFSAGFIDYVLNWGLATNPIMILPLGVAFFALYFFTFTAAIRFFDLKTPGREDEETLVADTELKNQDLTDLAYSFYAAAGGYTNIQQLNCCMTRLRIQVDSSDLVDVNQCKKLGASGVIKPTPTTAQIIVGPKAELITAELRKIHQIEASKDIEHATASVS